MKLAQLTLACVFIAYASASSSDSGSYSSISSVYTPSYGDSYGVSDTISSVSPSVSYASSVSSSVSYVSSASPVSYVSSASPVSYASSVSSSVSYVSSVSPVSYVSSVSPVSYVSSVSPSVSSVSSSYSMVSVSSIPSTFTFTTYSVVYSLEYLLPPSMIVTPLSSQLLAEVSEWLQDAQQVVSSIYTYAVYDELLLAAYPQIKCAENTLEQDTRSHAATVSEIEDAISSPSLVTDPTYIELKEESHPSIVTAYQKIFDFESTHHRFAYGQTLVSAVESKVGNLWTDISLIIDEDSPTTAAAIDVLSSAVEYSPSLTSYLHTITELASHYPSFSSAERVIAYYALKSPSLASPISDYVLSPVTDNVILPASYPTLANAIITVIDDEKTIPKDSTSFILKAISSPSLVPSNDKHEVSQLKSKYKTFWSAAEIVHSYKISSPVLVTEVETEIKNPAPQHAATAIEHPSLAHACAVAEEYAEKSPSAEKLVAEIVASPNSVPKSLISAAKSAYKAHSALASAESVIAKYKKSSQRIEEAVSKEIASHNNMVSIKTVKAHPTLVSAFKEVASVNNEFPPVKIAQSVADCAESSAAAVEQAFNIVQAAKNAAANSISHGAIVLKAAQKVAN